MKSNTIIIGSLILFSACNSIDNQMPVQQPQLTIGINDISCSFDDYATLNQSHVKSIIDGIGRCGGGKFYGLHIMSNSAKQDPIVAEIPALNLLKVAGNGFQQSNQTRRNNELTNKFKTIADSLISSISDNLIVPKNHDFSDLKSALELAKTILKNPQYLNYEKKLLIISDMENDFPPNDGLDKMTPVKIPKDVQVLLVRPSERINLEEVIPGTDISMYTSIEDAINAMFHK